MKKTEDTGWVSAETITVAGSWLNYVGKLLKMISLKSKHASIGTYLVAQWLRLHAPNARGPGSIPGQVTRSHMHAATKSSHATTKEPESHN